MSEIKMNKSAIGDHYVDDFP